MPGETRNYVSAITGLTVDDWAAEQNTGEKKEDKKVEARRTPSCGRAEVAMLKKSPTPFMDSLTKRVIQALITAMGCATCRRLLA